MRFVTKATPIGYIDIASIIEANLKAIVGYSDFISREWFFITWGWTHTHIQTHILTSTPKGFQETRHAPGLKQNSLASYVTSYMVVISNIENLIC